jgi:hypothetical protein
MRRTLIPMLAAVLAFGCADVPSAPLLAPSQASFAFSYDHPPPPFAIVNGELTTEYGTVNFVGHFFTNKPGNIAWLQFKSTTTADASFSANARIMSVNGDVSGVGTLSIGDNTIQLSGIQTFTYQTYRSNRSISFSGGDVRLGTALGPKGIGIDEGDVACTTAC